MRIKGLPTSNHSYVLVSVDPNCRNIHDPWLSRTNPLNFIHGAYIEFTFVCSRFIEHVLIALLPISLPIFYIDT